MQNNTMKNKKLGNKLLCFLENNIASNDSSNDVAKEKELERRIKIIKKDIESIMQQLITIATEGLTIPLDTNKNNISNLELVSDTILGLAQDLQEKIDKLKI